jgi:predicted permease
MTGVRRWLRVRSVERDVDEEIAFHLAQLVEDLERQGWTPGAAREEAARQFGDQGHYRRQLMKIDGSAARREQWSRRLEGVRGTLKYAVRGIVRSPGLSLGIVLAFALGLGANATMYETVERMLLKPPAHIVDADGVGRLLIERDVLGERRHSATMAYSDYRDFTEVAGFSHVAAVARREVTVGSGESAERVRAVLATASYWPLLGVQPMLGRFYTEAEDRFGAEGVVVLSWTRWQAQYGGSADALGRTVDFGYGPWTIIGVAPKGFTGENLSPVDLFVPFMAGSEKLQGTADWANERNWFFMNALARIDPSHTREAAAVEATTRHRAGRKDLPRYDSLATVVAAPLLEAQGPNAPSEATVAKWLLGVAAVVLLIACLNVANLLLARMLRQRREMAVRLALGSSRLQLVGQVAVEGVLLGLLGGSAALLLALWGGTAVQRMLLPDIEWSGGATPSLLLFVLGLSVVAGGLSAVVPALQASRRDLADGLRGAGGITRSNARARATLTAAQAALSLLLLVGAGLFVRSLDRIHRADFGIALWELAYVSPSFRVGTSTDEERSRFLEEAAERVARLPGVSSATTAMGIPFWSAYAYDLRVQGRDSLPPLPTGGPYANQVDPRYFETMGLRLLRGRLFEEGDGTGAQPVAIVNASFAEVAWPGEDALGRCLYVGRDDPPCSMVVGVVNDARRDALVEETTAQYYLPLAQRQVTGGPDALLVRIPGPMPEVLASVQREVLGMDSRVRYVRSMPMEELVTRELRQWRLGAALFSLFGLLALAVAAIGLYSVLAFDVAQRVREIGLRTALGASQGTIMRLVVSRSLRITAAGMAAGLICAAMLAPRLRDLLYQVSPHDPLTLVVVVATLYIVSLLAAWIPAWRASRVDPNVALRAD